jgi:hypothetical protein
MSICLFIASHGVRTTILTALPGVLSLLWIIYRDIFSKPKLRLHFGFQSDFLPPDPNREPRRPFLIITNRGEGEISIEAIMLRTRAWFWRPLGKPIVEDVTSFTLINWIPMKLELGQRWWVAFRLENCVLNRSALRIGVRASSGRNYWAPSADFKKAQSNWLAYKEWLYERGLPCTDTPGR